MTQAEDLELAVKSGAARALRQSLLGSADICLRRAQYDLAPPGPKRTSEAAIIGTGYHAGLELYYRERMAFEGEGHEPMHAGWPGYLSKLLAETHNKIVEEIERYEPHLITWDTNPAGAIKAAQTMVSAYFDQGHQWGAEYTVLGVEVPFWLPSPYPGWVNHGTIDLVLHGPDPCEESPVDGVVLADHKTTSRKWDQKKHTSRKTAQIITYYEAWQEMTGEVPLAFVFDLMNRKGEFERRRVRPVQAEIDAFREKRDETVELLSSGRRLPGNPTSNLCSSKYCAWWSNCPWGEAFGV